MLNKIDNAITEILQSSPGNTREVDISIKAGSLTIDGTNDQIVFNLDKSHYQLSEPNKKVDFGNIAVYTHPFNDINNINMSLNYTQYNLTYQKGDTIKTITTSSTPYSLFITNYNGAKINIDFSLG